MYNYRLTKTVRGYIDLLFLDPLFLYISNLHELWTMYIFGNSVSVCRMYLNSAWVVYRNQIMVSGQQQQFSSVTNKIHPTWIQFWCTTVNNSHKAIGLSPVWQFQGYFRSDNLFTPMGTANGCTSNLIHIYLNKVASLFSISLAQSMK